MQFWALILIVYLAGAFVLRDNFSDMLLHSEKGWLVILAVTVLVIAAFGGVIRNLLSFLSEDRHRVLHGLAALACIAGIEYLNADFTGTADAPATLAQGQGQTQGQGDMAAMALSPRETALQRSWDGHFRAIATIGEANVGALIDTGASLVLLRNDDAKRIGINLDALDFTTPLTTVNGKSYVAPLVLDTLTIGNVTVHNVRAAVAEPGALHSTLLGMSYLEALGEVVLQKDRMILRE